MGSKYTGSKGHRDHGGKITHGTAPKYDGPQIDVSGLDLPTRNELVKYAISRTAYSVGGKVAVDPSGSIVGTLFQGADRNAAGPAAMNGVEQEAYGALHPRMKELVDGWIAWKRGTR